MKLELMAVGAATVFAAGLATPAVPAVAAPVSLTTLQASGQPAATSLRIAGTTTDGSPVTISVDAKPNTDANRVAADARLTRQAALHPGVSAQNVQASMVNGHLVQYDPSFNQPRFMWAAPQAAPAGGMGPLMPAVQLERQARDYLASQSTILGLTGPMLAEAELTEAQFNGDGPAVVRFGQRVNGTEVFNKSLNVMLDRQGRPVAVSGGFATTYSPAAVPAAPAQVGTPAQAVVAALSDLGVSASAGQFGAATTVGRYQVLPRPTTAFGTFAFDRAPRVRPVYYPEGSSMVPAYYVEIQGTMGAAQPAYMYVVAAATGRQLFRMNMRAEVATTYRVFADPSGINQPYDSPLGNGFDPGPTTPGVLQARPKNGANLLTLDYAPMLATKDPWLAAGATTTTGNNVDAFLDNAPQASGVPIAIPAAVNGYRPGDVRAAPTATNTYDYAIHADDDPSTANSQQAAIVNLFYMNNWLHDFWYGHGFNELAGNGQTSNYGRGGVEGDAISAQGQDSSGRNNANMATPADGSTPVMQMYLFDGPLVGEVRETAPAKGSPLVFKQASFGPLTYNVTGPLHLANDGDAKPTNGCNDTIVGANATAAAAAQGTPDPTASGTIVLVDRGVCSFTIKERFAAASNATAMIVVNNDPTAGPIVMGDSTVPSPGSTPPMVASTYPVPSVMISFADGKVLKDLLAKGAVTMHVERDASPDYDGTLDEQVISHEFYHYVSGRLIGNGSGLGNQQGGGMNEGWSDDDSMILTVRPEDMLISGNELYQGTYPLAFYVFIDQYYGIRRMPYSTQFKYNSLTYKHTQDGTRLDSVDASQGQVVAPAAYGTDGATNSEVHATGEVWANMMWNCYAGIQDTPNNGSFVQKRSRYMDYVIAGQKMTPVDPTFTQARDGLLAAMFATNAADYQACARGFAKRGAGVYAISAPSSATNNVGVTESYVAFVAQYAMTKAAYVAGFKDCDDDGILDSNESGAYTLTFRNDGTYVPTAPVTATITTTTAGITLGNGGRVTIPALGLGQTAQVSIPVAAGQLTGSPLAVPLSIAFDPVAPNDKAVQPMATVVATVNANYDGAVDRTSDDMENATESMTDWTRANTGGAPWALVAASSTQGTGTAWHAADADTASDVKLTTPEFSVPAGGAFSMDFTHTFDFEYGVDTNNIVADHDGGVMEVSIDGGPWQDVTGAGGSFTKGKGYTATFTAAGRQGFTESNSGPEAMTLSFPTSLAGHSARLRFREITDDNASVQGASGWYVDNVAMHGAAAPMFSTIKPNSGICLVKTPSPFSFQTRTNVPVSTFITSEAITLAGFTGTAPISVSGDNSMQYSINGAPFTSAPGRVATGSRVVVRHLSAATNGVSVTTNLIVGTLTAQFTSVTGTLDRVPDAFDFGEQDNVTPGTQVTSAPVTPVAYDVATVSAGPGMSFSIDGGAFTSGSGTINKGQTITARLTSATRSLAYARGYVTIGGVKGYFTVRTKK